jgi:hypothetical protein
VNTLFQPQILEEELWSFLKVRDRNPVIRDLFIPEAILEEFKRFHRKYDEVAFHRSILLLAHQNDELAKLCSPLHTIIFDRWGGERLSKQYRKDLVENWYLANDPRRRFERSKMFMGKVLEFHTAVFLEKHHKWLLNDMEAFHEEKSGSDILFTSEQGRQVAVSCKSPGQHPQIFDLSLEALADKDGCSSAWLSMYSTADYLLYLIATAANDIQAPQGGRRLVVISLMNPENFKIQLRDNWIDFSRPKFLNLDTQFDEDSDMAQFWKSQSMTREKAVETARELPNLVDGIVILAVARKYRISVLLEHWYRFFD